MKKLFALLILITAPAFAQGLPSASSLVGEWNGTDGTNLACHASVTERLGVLSFTVSGADGTASLSLVPAFELDSKIASDDAFRRQNDKDYTGDAPSLNFYRGENEIDTGWRNGAPDFINVTNAEAIGPFINPNTRIIASCFSLVRAN
jgi:hypothetical protein